MCSVLLGFWQRFEIGQPVDGLGGLCEAGGLRPV